MAESEECPGDASAASGGVALAIGAVIGRELRRVEATTLAAIALIIA